MYVSIPHSCPQMSGHCDVITPPNRLRFGVSFSSPLLVLCVLVLQSILHIMVLFIIRGKARAKENIYKWVSV